MKIRTPSKKHKIRFIKMGLLLVISLFIIMIFTVPSDERFQKWVIQEYGMDCNEKGECVKDNENISFSSSHIRDTGIFASSEIIYEYENGQMITSRTLGILGAILKMNNGPLWDILN